MEPKFKYVRPGELKLMASDEAKGYSKPQKKSAEPPETVRKNAQDRAMMLGGRGSQRNRKHVLGQYQLQFGKYQGQKFQWVLSNDVGWATGVCASVSKETETDTPLSNNKFRLLDYVRLFPAVNEVMLKKSQPKTTPSSFTVSTTPASSQSEQPHQKVQPSDDLDDGQLVRAAEEVEAIEGDTIYKAWKPVMQPCDQRWISKALFRVNQQGKPEMCFDGIKQMWYQPPQPPLQCTQPPLLDRYFSRPIFLWMPKKLWRVLLSCPDPACGKRELISAGLYRTLRKVLGMSGYYYLAAEYLECPRCHKKVISWSDEILSQLDVGHRLQFPCILTRQMGCDLEVVKMLRQRGLGNSVSRLRQNLEELHGEEMLRRTAHYLSDCQTFTEATKRGLLTTCPFPSPPSPEKVPSYQWLTTVFCRDVLSRLDEVKASLTSTYGRVIKVDSTKKVVRKLQGTAAGTASWVTNVGNEHGQILMSVVTAGEGAGLDAMFTGLEDRYRDAGISPPDVLYVDRDCCGPNFVGRKFQQWKEIQVRLDIWHFMRRIASTCTTESHPLYPKFMRQLSGCIFQWCSEDLQALKAAKEGQLDRDGVLGGQPMDWITKKELALHCRRGTRSSDDITELISELLQVYCGEQGRDLLGTPLLNANKVDEMWKVQQNHVPCLLDPPGSQLYVQTGVLKKGRNMLPTYRCARGSTSLESFHLHLNRFIPGTSANDVHYQAYLLEGLYRWNQDRASQAVDGHAAYCHTYSGLLRHTVNRLAEKVLGNPLDPSYKAPRMYTGELIGVEYLYAQTGRALQTVLQENEEDEGETEDQADLDEGFVDDLDDLTIPEATSQPSHHDLPVSDLSIQQTSPVVTAHQSPSTTMMTQSVPSVSPEIVPAFVPLEPTVSTAPTISSGAPAVKATQMTSTDLPPVEFVTEEQTDPSDGLQLVHNLADFLVELDATRVLSRSQEDQVIALWDKLYPFDKRPTIMQPRSKSSPRGRFMSSKTSKGPVKSNEEKTKRCFVGSASGPASFPDANRYMEEVIKRLLERYPTPQKRPTGTLTRWTLILNVYEMIRRAVIDNGRVMALTALQLLPINNTTLLSWHKRRQKSEEELLLSQGIEVSTPSFTAPDTQPVPAALGRPVTLSSQTVAPQFTFILPPNTAGMSKVRVRCPKPPQNTAAPRSQIFQMQMPVQNRMPCPPNPWGTIRRTPVIQPAPLPSSLSETQPPVLRLPKSTASYRKKVEKMKEDDGVVKQYKARKAPNKFGQCGQPKIAPDHRQYFGNWFCANKSDETYEAWREKMKEKGYSSRKRPAQE